MRKVEFTKLNLQQENLLSKEEKKELLGGTIHTCYVKCNNSSSADEGRVDSCHIPDLCGREGIYSCYCEG